MVIICMSLKMGQGCLINLSFILISRHMPNYWLNYKDKKVIVIPSVRESFKEIQEFARREFKGLNKVEPSKLVLQYDQRQIKTTRDYQEIISNLTRKKVNEATFIIKKPKGYQSDGEESEDSEKPQPNSDEDQEQEQEQEGVSFDSNEEVHGSEKGRDSEEARGKNKKGVQKHDSEQASDETSENDSVRHKEEQSEEDQQQESLKKDQQQGVQEEENSQEQQQDKPVDVQPVEESSQEPQQSQQPVEESSQEPQQSQQPEEPQAIIDNNSKPAQPKAQEDQDSELDQPFEDKQYSQYSSSSEEEEQDVQDKPQENNQDSEQDNGQQRNQSEADESIQSSYSESDGEQEGPPPVVLPSSQDENSQDKEEIVDEPKQTSREEAKQKTIQTPKKPEPVKKKTIQKPKAAQLPSNQLKMVDAGNKQISAIKKQNPNQRQTISNPDKDLIAEVNKHELLFAEMQDNMGLMLERLATLQREKAQKPMEPIVSTGCNGCGLLNTKLSRKKIGSNFLNIYFCDGCDSRYEVSLRQK